MNDIKITPFSSISIVDFEQVIVSWDIPQTNKIYCVLSPTNLISISYSKFNKGTKITRSHKKILK